MIKISKQSEYAFQLLSELNNLNKDELLSLKKLSTKSSISFLFLQKIARLLREKGIIMAVKGKMGGYRLRRPLDKISLLEVIEAVDGPCGLTDCLNSKSCNRLSKCTIKGGLAGINKKITTYLDITMLSDIL